MIYSSNDDYSGAALTNPTVPPEFTNVTSASVVIGKHVIIGSGSVILPGVILQEGVAIGALSLVNRNCERFCIYAGSPAKLVRSRSEKLLEAEHRYLAWLAAGGGGGGGGGENNTSV
jgi:galactoside O-acetyltransferase